MNILIIEDDIILAEKIAKVFRITWNFNNIKLLHTFNSFMREYHIITSYDIVLVDIILSNDFYDKNNWIKIVDLIRKKSETIPIIVISWLGDINWLENAFWNWVNDYLVKPFKLRELEIRVDRWFKIFLYNNLNTKKTLDYFDLTKDLYTCDFYYKNKKIDLTKNSKYILTLFISNPEKLLKDSFLIDKIWWDISSVIERNPRVNISRLKKSLDVVWIWDWITNIRGEWYILKKNN
jgi:two-component system OmpR family response regulator